MGKISDAAMLIAIEAHDSDRNKHDGELYILHVARVVINTRNALLHISVTDDEVKQAVAWLHDTLEDTHLTTGNLLTQLEFDYHLGHDLANEIVVAVHAMTKQKGETNEDYYHRVKLNEHARFVKLHGDMVDNFRRNHLITDNDTRLRMAAKYSLGMDILS